jgi:hypothetical protein
MASHLERRRFSRIMVSLPLTYQTRLPETDAPLQGQGIVRDISLSGAYFHVEPDATFQPGQILSLTIAASLPYLEDTGLTHLQTTGEVVRFDPPAPHHSQAGVALNFLDNLCFCPAPAPPTWPL